MPLIDLDDLLATVIEQDQPSSLLTIRTVEVSSAIALENIHTLVREAAEERAAIQEFDGSLSRKEAESRNGIVRCMDCKHWNHLEPAARTRHSCLITAAEPWMIYEFEQIPAVLAVCDKKAL